MGSERRNCARRVLYSPEYLDMGADNGGVVVDLSEGGLRFQAVGRVEAGSHVPLSFSLGTGYRIDAEARVVWLSPRGNSGGVAFKKLSSDSLSLIREWLAKPEAEHRAESAVSTAEGEEERQIPMPAEVSAGAPVGSAATANAQSLASEAFGEQPHDERIEEIAPPDDPVIRAHFEQEPRPAPVSQLRTAVLRASAAPVPPASIHSLRSAPAAKRTSAVNPGSSFSAVPSISAWSGKESAAPRLSTRPPLESGAPLFPPRGAENIFARNRWQPQEIEERHPVRNFFLIVLALVIVGAVLIGIAWERGYRQEIGAAIERVGSTVAGQSESGTSSGATPAPGQSANSSGAASSSQSAPKSSAPAAGSPATTSSGVAASPAASLPQGSVPNATAPNSASNSSLNSGSGASGAASNSPTLAKQPPATQNPNGTSTGQPAETPVQNPPQNPSAPANLKQASNQRPGQTNSASAPSSADLAQSAAQSEFLRAQQYLTGSGVPQDPATAAEWFWRSLEAGNTAAAVPLADLYIAGKGVSRSCVQARILLDTAARKGNPEAAHKLAELPANCD